MIKKVALASTAIALSAGIISGCSATTDAPKSDKDKPEDVTIVQPKEEGNIQEEELFEPEKNIPPVVYASPRSQDVIPPNRDESSMEQFQ